MGWLWYFSPNFQRYVREQIRQWAPGVPAYILPQAAQPGTFQSDHKVAWDAYDGTINYIYPGVLPDHVDVMRTIPQDYWAFHAQQGSKPWLLLGKAFAFDASRIPPKGSLIAQWEAAERAGVPLAGFGFYSFFGHAFNISSVRPLQQECREVNRLITERFFDVRIEQNLKRTQANSAEVTFQAKVFGSKPPFVFQWEFGDGGVGWGDKVVHTYSRPGAYQPKVTCLDGRGLSASKLTRIYVMGPLATAVREDFEDGVADNFTVRGGEWRIEQGRYTQTRAASEPAWASLSTGLSRLYSIETDITFTAPDGEAWILWSGAALNPDSRLSWRVPADPDFTLKGTSLLELRTDSGIAKAYLAFDRSHTHHVAVDVFADVVTVSVDGKFLLEQSSSSQGGDGVVGVGVKNTRAAFDNFSVALLPGLKAAASIAGTEPLSAPYVVNFSAGTVGGREPFTFAWDFGDGAKSNLQDPQHVYADKGAWRAELQVTDTVGQTASSSVIVMTGAGTYYREAEDYDWTDGAAPGYPTEAAQGVRYGSGQKGRRGVDYWQLHSDEGDLSGGRDLGGVSLETGKSDTGINIRSAGATDWWNYTFKFPSPGVARIRALWSSDGSQPRLCRVYWKNQAVGDLVIPGKGEQNYAMLETPPFPVDASLGQVQFRPMDWGLGYARFEVVYVPSLDSDGDGIVDLFDLDSDNDGYMDVDETTNGQSNPLDATSRPKDTDGDHLSDGNDPKDNNRYVNSAPSIRAIPDQTVLEGAVLDLNLGNPNLGTTPGLLREVFTGIAGLKIADLTGSSKFPSRPDRSLSLTDYFETPRDSGDNYGQRLRGFLVAPQTGDYSFWIASDDASVLYLSNDEWSDHARLIASVNAWTDYRQWTKEPNQKSAPVHLEAGKRYYVEALMKEGEGGDNLSVRWQLPSGALETPIPGSRLLAWVKDPPMVIANDPDLPGQQLTFSLGPGVPTGSAIDPATGRLTWTPDRFQADKTHSFTVRVTDDGNPPLSAETTFNVNVTKRINAAPVLASIPDQTLMEGQTLDLNLTSVGRSPGLLREVFSGINGNYVADLTGSSKFPNRPDDVSFLTNGFETPINVAENYGQRLRGFVVAPQTGYYTFWIASDDASVLYFSRDENAANKRLIAGVNGWTEYRQWTLEANQKSAPIQLEEGKRYYVEALMKEGCCDDHLSVRWQLPDGRFETPIPASRLLVWERNPVPVIFATDPDLPLQQLTYSLAQGAPTGSTIDPATGRVTWTPTKAQIPGNYTFTVTVTDNGDPPLSDAQTFYVALKNEIGLCT